MDKKPLRVVYPKQAVKKCPYCARMVLDTAVVCDYCHRPLVLPISRSIKKDLIYGLIIGILIIAVLVIFPPQIKPQVHIRQEQLPLREGQSEAKQKENPKANLKQARQEEEWQIQQFHKQVRQQGEWQLQQLHKQAREEERARNDTREIDSILNKAQDPL
ncbi:MAG: hypothetical protein ABSB18_00100 [Candidatus Omnitrophota bacterium]